jgi:hypothetical protein
MQKKLQFYVQNFRNQKLGNPGLQLQVPIETVFTKWR